MLNSAVYMGFFPRYIYMLNPMTTSSWHLPIKAAVPATPPRCGVLQNHTGLLAPNLGHRMAVVPTNG